MSQGGNAAVVSEFLDAMVAHDWDRMAGCVADDVHRVGPYGDEYQGKGDYVAFIADTLPRLRDYRMEVARVVVAGDLVIAELSETVGADGRLLCTPEALVFDFDHGRISHIAVYTQDGHEPGEKE
ncbi:MAG: nuclear transport factor 2 family protein [Acidimicrobiia bacterium]